MIKWNHVSYIIGWLCAFTDSCTATITTKSSNNTNHLSLIHFSLNTPVHTGIGHCQLKEQRTQPMYYVEAFNKKCKDHKIRFNIDDWKWKISGVLMAAGTTALQNSDILPLHSLVISLIQLVFAFPVPLPFPPIFKPPYTFLLYIWVYRATSYLFFIPQ